MKAKGKDAEVLAAPDPLQGVRACCVAEGIEAASSFPGMLAIALGLEAVDAGHRVYYTTTAELVARTSKAAAEGRWAATMRFWAGPAVLMRWGQFKRLRRGHCKWRHSAAE